MGKFVRPSIYFSGYRIIVYLQTFRSKNKRFEGKIGPKKGKLIAEQMFLINITFSIAYLLCRNLSTFTRSE